MDLFGYWPDLIHASNAIGQIRSEQFRLCSTFDAVCDGVFRGVAPSVSRRNGLFGCGWPSRPPTHRCTLVGTSSMQAWRRRVQIGPSPKRVAFWRSRFPEGVVGELLKTWRLKVMQFGPHRSIWQTMDLTHNRLTTRGRAATKYRRSEICRLFKMRWRLLGDFGRYSHDGSHSWSRGLRCLSLAGGGWSSLDPA